MNIAEYYLNFLYQNGCRYAFGIPGKGIMPFWQATLNSKIKLVLARHESGAAFIADGWSRAKLKLSLVLTTMGPGVTNVITGIATAFCDSIPLVLITGQSKTCDLGLGNFQESSCVNRNTDVNALLKPITKISLEAHTAKEAVNYLKIAYTQAVSGRMGPVHISLPYDVQLVEAVLETEKLNKKQEIDNTTFFNKEILITNLFRNSKRPIILAGWGLYLSQAGQKLIHFSQKYNLPTISTIKGKAVIPSTFKNYVGHIGQGSTSLTKDFLANYAPDLFLVLGSSLGMLNACFLQQYLDKAKVIQIDMVAESKSVVVKVDHFLNCDLNLFLEANINNLKNDLNFFQNDWQKIIKKLKQKEKTKKKLPFSFQIIEELNQIMPENTVFLPDAGNHWLLSLNKIRTKSPGSFFTGIGLASMGQAIGCAIGFKLAYPQKPVVCLTGDGSMLMYGSEVSTAVDLKLPIIFLVFNNASLGRILKAQKEDFDNKIGGTYIPKVDFTAWAKSLGANSFKAKTLKQFKKRLLESINIKKPTVVDIDFPEIDEIPL